MIDIFDAMLELVYVVDIEKYDLLYMNTAGKEQFHLETVKNLKCYQAIQGRDAPCTFCTTPWLREDSYYTWEMTNPITKRHYLLKDKLITWEGRQARIQIAFDMTEQRDMLDAETLLVNSVKVLQFCGSFAETVLPVLQKLGLYADAVRTYALETEGTLIREVYEWKLPESPSFEAELRGRDLSEIQWKSVWGYTALTEVYPVTCEGSLQISKHAAGVYIVVVDPVATHLPHLRMVLQTLANFMSSVHQSQRYQKQLEQLSFNDPLTGVLNRNAFTHAMEQSGISADHSAGVIHLSINGIKEINDKKGRKFGDRVLCDIAHKLQFIMKDTKVYRVGGDEFVAVWEGTHSRYFENCIRAALDWQTNETIAKFALGYHWSNDCLDLQVLASQAETQMYQNKKGFYRNTMLPKRYRPTSDLVLDFASGDSLDQLLAEGRFVVYFQPKFSVEGHRLIGAEALIRFLSEKQQLFAPDQFIPFLEEARLIHRVDFYVFRHVCATIASWIFQGLHVVPVSVNFSRYTIQEPWFLDTLIDIWKTYAIPKEYIEIEITESAEENAGLDLLSLLTKIRNYGFPVSIDDFGVKYANLSVFTNGDFTTLKIDKSLISDWENPRTGEILRALCEICRNTDVCLIAEGVESIEQLDFLQSIKCEAVQGYLFSRPLPQASYEQQYLTIPPAVVSAERQTKEFAK